MTLLLLAVLVGTLAATIVAHEAAHYVACRAVGADAELVVRWAGINTAPAIRTNHRQHTPTTLRVVALAPLTLALPVVAAVAVGTIPTANVEAAMVAAVWSFGAFLSGSDLKVVRDAGDVTLLREAELRAFARPHAAAEGF